jgi:hypothetical protein
MGPATEDAIARYFAAERRGAAVFLALGLAALAASALLWTSSGTYRGMVPPLFALGLIEVMVGATVYLRTPRQVAALRARLDTDEGEARREELERMRRVMAGFRVYRAIELVLLTGGLTLLMLFPRRHHLYAAGLGCVVQGSVMLVLDRLAERRGGDYTAALARRD